MPAGGTGVPQRHESAAERSNRLEIPEADYPELATLDGLVAYVQRKKP